MIRAWLTRHLCRPHDPVARYSLLCWSGRREWQPPELFEALERDCRE